MSSFGQDMVKTRSRHGQDISFDWLKIHFDFILPFFFLVQSPDQSGIYFPVLDSHA
jgi:hypothetical protein